MIISNFWPDQPKATMFTQQLMLILHCRIIQILGVFIPIVPIVISQTLAFQLNSLPLRYFICILYSHLVVFHICGQLSENVWCLHLNWIEYSTLMIIQISDIFFPILPSLMIFQTLFAPQPKLILPTNIFPCHCIHVFSYTNHTLITPSSIWWHTQYSKNHSIAQNRTLNILVINNLTWLW